MRSACRIAGWQGLTALAGKATEAEKLELEAHLAICARCAEEHALLAPMRRLRDPQDHDNKGANVEGEALGAAAHERIRRAMSTAGPGARQSLPARRVWWPLGAGAALALGAAAIVLGPLRHAGRGGSPAVASSRPAVAGDVVVGEEAGGVATFRSERGGRVQLDDVAAELAPGTELAWHRSEHQLAVRRGRLSVDRAESAQGRVQIRIALFRVEIAGARFTADARGVRAERGHVRVVRADGVAAELAAGQSWTAESEEAPTATTTATATATATATTTPRATAALATRAASAGGVGAGGELATAQRLTRARQALGRGDASAARGALRPLFDLDRPVAAEARVLHAESFLIEGRYADAIEAYRVVTRDFPATSQAESALFAMAQLESEHGNAADGVAAFRRYLDRYPTGRFAREASERIARLAPPGR